MNEKEELINLYFTFKSDAVLTRLLQKYGKTVLLEMDDYAESSDIGLYMYVNMVIAGSVKEELYQLNSKQLKKVFNNIISRFSDEQNIDFKYDVIKFMYDYNFEKEAVFNYTNGAIIRDKKIREVNINFVKRLYKAEIISTESVNFSDDIIDALANNEKISMDTLLELIASGLDKLAPSVIANIEKRKPMCNQIGYLMEYITEIKYALLKINSDSNPKNINVESILYDGLDEFFLSGFFITNAMDIITSILKTPDNYIMAYKETYDLFFEVFTVVANDADIIHDIVNSSHEKIGNFPFEYFGPHIADRSLTGLLCAMYYHDTLLSYQVTDYMEMNFKYNIQCVAAAMHKLISCKIIPMDYLENTDNYRNIVKNKFLQNNFNNDNIEVDVDSLLDDLDI